MKDEEERFRKKSPGGNRSVVFIMERRPQG